MDAKRWCRFKTTAKFDKNRSTLLFFDCKEYHSPARVVFQTTGSAAAAACAALTKAVFGEKRPQHFGLAFWRACTCGALAWA